MAKPDSHYVQQKTGYRIAPSYLSKPDYTLISSFELRRTIEIERKQVLFTTTITKKHLTNGSFFKDRFFPFPLFLDLPRSASLLSLGIVSILPASLSTSILDSFSSLVEHINRHFEFPQWNAQQQQRQDNCSNFNDIITMETKDDSEYGQESRNVLENVRSYMQKSRFRIK